MRQRWDGVSVFVRLMFAAISIAGWAALFDRPAYAADENPTTRQLEILVRNADFDAAETVGQRLLRSGALARADAVRVYLQLGIVSSAKRDTERAEAAFRKALRLDGDVRLSSSVGPHVAANLARAKASVSFAGAIDPTVALTSPAGSGELLVETTARKDEDGLLRRVSVRIGDARETRDLGEAPLRFSMALPVTLNNCATATAAILDEFGNELWPEVATAEICRAQPSAPVATQAPQEPAVSMPRAGTPSAAPEIVATTARTTSQGPSRTFWIAAAVTGAAVLGTTLLGLTALERRDEYHQSLSDRSGPDEQARLRDRAAIAQQRATVGGLVAGVFAVTAVVLYVSGRF
jgi:hypothetical protein